MINRISLNGCRYVVSTRISDLREYCRKYNIKDGWIRFSLKNNKYYLRLWGRYKHRGKSLCDSCGRRSLHTYCHAGIKMSDDKETCNCYKNQDERI